MRLTLNTKELESNFIPTEIAGVEVELVYDARDPFWALIRPLGSNDQTYWAPTNLIIGYGRRD
jgi:hypothetical protein